MLSVVGGEADRLDMLSEVVEAGGETDRLDALSEIGEENGENDRIDVLSEVHVPRGNDETDRLNALSEVGSERSGMMVIMAILIGWTRWQKSWRQLVRLIG